MPRHIPMSVSDNLRPHGDLSAMVARWRANDITPPATIQAMPDRVPAGYSWLEVAAVIAILLIVAVVGGDMGARF